jgi:hypothetical protein
MDDERRRRAAEQEERARRALESIMNGGDLTQETLDLSNEFTDRQTARLTGWWRRFRKPRATEIDESGPPPE